MCIEAEVQKTRRRDARWMIPSLPPSHVGFISLLLFRETTVMSCAARSSWLCFALSGCSAVVWYWVAGIMVLYRLKERSFVWLAGSSGG